MNLAGMGHMQPTCHLHDGLGLLEGCDLELNSCTHAKSVMSTDPRGQNVIAARAEHSQVYLDINALFHTVPSQVAARDCVDGICAQPGMHGGERGRTEREQ